jgi:hypothetical protein
MRWSGALRAGQPDPTRRGACVSPPCRYGYRHSRGVDPKSETRRKPGTFHSLLFGRAAKPSVSYWACLSRRKNRLPAPCSPAEDSARDAASGEAAGIKRIVYHYVNPSLTPRVSAPSASEPGEEETLDLPSAPRLTPRLRVSASSIACRSEAQPR